MKFGNFSKALIAGSAFFVLATQQVSAQGSSSSSDVQQQIVNSVIQNIVQNVRDQVYRRRLAPIGGAPLQFSGEDGVFDNRDPFAANASGNPFAALAYSKAYTKAPPMAPVSMWLYGANLVGSGERAATGALVTHVSTITGAFDVTKIGVFTSSDALTFIGTGSNSWGTNIFFDTTTPSTSGTLSYLNGGWSADFTAAVSWTRTSATPPFAAFDTSGISYTFNTQYRFDFPTGYWIEPTVGVNYSEAYLANLSGRVGDTTDVRGGLRVGSEFKWMGYTIQPTISGMLVQVVDANGPLGPVAKPGLGGRGSGKLNVLWSSNLSTYAEIHGGVVGGATVFNFVQPDTNSFGGQLGLRYTWN